MKLLSTILMLAFAISVHPALASFIGNTIIVDAYYMDLGKQEYSPTHNFIGASTIPLAGADFLLLPPMQGFDVFVAASNIYVENTSQSNIALSSPYILKIFGPSEFTTSIVGVSSNVLAANRLSFTNSSISIDLSNLFLTPNTFIPLNVSFAADSRVPEPTTYSIVFAGLALLSGFRLTGRTKQRH